MQSFFRIAYNSENWPRQLEYETGMKIKLQNSPEGTMKESEVEKPMSIKSLLQRGSSWKGGFTEAFEHPIILPCNTLHFLRLSRSPLFFLPSKRRKHQKEKENKKYTSFSWITMLLLLIYLFINVYEEL